MKSIYVTRAIPEVGLQMLRAKGYAVTVSPRKTPPTEEEPISRPKALSSFFLNIPDRKLM